MSDQEQFQSAERLCELEIVGTLHNYGEHLTPRRKVMENNLQWKFEKIKRIMPTSLSPCKPQAKNISFQTDDLGQISDDEKSCQSEQRTSVFQNLYKNCEQVYRKQKTIGTNWHGHRQYFASVFVDPQKLAKRDLLLYKQKPLQLPSQVGKCQFDSSFESGNLYTAYEVKKNEYDLILQNDINTKGNTQWFYFQMTKMAPKTKVKINIVNMLKGDSLFNYGMQPCLHSAESEKKNGQGWFRSGTHIKYFRNQNKVDGSNRFYYTLTFTISTPYQGDVLKIAQCYPYTLTDLKQCIENAEKKPGRKNYIKRESAGQTVGKNSLQVIRIMEQNPRKKSPRGLIFVTARQHPGETPGSYACEGFIDFIVSDEKQAQYLRKNYEIVIIPMLNPDGVVVGNYRSNLCGLDLNRRWDGSKAKQSLQAVLVKRYIIEVSRNRQICFIIDLHGHSRKLFSFFYGNSGLHSPEDVRIYPYICSKLSENMIRFEDSTFACEESKRRTARIQMFTKFKIPNIFTFQTSFFGFYGKNREKVHYTQQKLMNLGAILGKSMYLYERNRNNPESVQALMVKKFIDDLRNKPELITCGEKIGSGSESDPEKGEIGDLDYQRLEDDVENQKDKKKKKSPSKNSKRQILIKDVPKQSRQLHVMDIARVNSIFPNDILALMPSSMGRKVAEKQRIRVDKNSVMTQTEDVPLIKIYDICKYEQINIQKRQQSFKKKIAIKNQSQVSNISRSNLFRTIIRPKSSSNSYLEINLKNTPVKKQLRKRHDSGYEVKQKSYEKKKINVFSQTNITFAPSTDFMAQTLDSLIINPVSKGLESLKNRSKFATLNQSPEPPISTDSKRSTQSFKIGLRALNVQTWRIKKKNFQ